MLANDPFGIALERARQYNACPVSFLDGFYTNHWDFDTLCGGFKCYECVADPTDMGFGDYDDVPLFDEGGCDADIPF